MKLIIHLDDFSSEIFYEMERLSEGREGHKYETEANNKKEAAEKLLEKLKPFIEKQFEEDDSQNSL
jgi:hypothetical protein